MFLFGFSWGLLGLSWGQGSAESVHSSHVSYAIYPLCTCRNFFVKDHYCLEALGSLGILLGLFCGSWRVLGRLEAILRTLGLSWGFLGASWGSPGAKARENQCIVRVCLMLSIRSVHAGTPW